MTCGNITSEWTERDGTNTKNVYGSAAHKVAAFASTLVFVFVFICILFYNNNKKGKNNL